MKTVTPWDIELLKLVDINRGYLHINVLIDKFKKNRLYRNSLSLVKKKLRTNIYYKKLQAYTNLLTNEWSLDGQYNIKSTLFTYLFRTYIGPFWLLVIIFSIAIFSLIINNIIHYYEVRELMLTSSAMSQVELTRAVAKLNLDNSLFAIFVYMIFFISACFSVRTMTKWIYKSADLVSDNLKYTCETFNKDRKVKCVFARLNFMIGAIVDNRNLIDEYERSLLKKNEILDKNKKKYREVIDTSPDAILVMDKEFNFVESNITADKILGFNIVGEIFFPRTP